MKWRGKTALGIEICESSVSLALLRQGEDQLELVKAATAPLPNGAMKDGSIQDADVLQRVLKGLRVSGGIPRTARTAISLPAGSVVMQILEVPEQVPTNISRFVEGEMKRCVALSGRDLAFDFCQVGSGASSGSRLLAAAADVQGVTELAGICDRARFNVEVAEPPLLAYFRAFHAKKIAPKFDCNVLLAVLQDGVLTLCVFIKGALDFVRTKAVSVEELQSPGVCQHLAAEMDEIIRSYAVEATEASSDWEINVVTEAMQLPEDAEQLLKAGLGVIELSVTTRLNSIKDTPVEVDSSRGAACPVAVGLAMGLLAPDGGGLRMNLIPAESAKTMCVKKDLIITGNTVSVVLLLMILASGGLQLLTNKVNRRIDEKKQAGPSQSVHDLFVESQQLDKKIQQISERPNWLTDIFESRKTVDWPEVLKDIGRRTPKLVRITELSGKADAGINLEGLALTHEAVHTFVKILNDSEYFESASLNHTERDDGSEGLVRYSITCWLGAGSKSG